ncbi:chromate efflux transporter [Agaricicola taiwanensis]|nr:chromate efflux transporter [Agaricicola taiwanensis]
MPEVRFGEAVRVWARVAALSFGGPAGQIAVMHRILVDEKKWISENRFLHALNYCMLLPGPEAHQLSVYIGWLLNGTRGGLVAGGLFMLPGVLAILALSILYALVGNTDVVSAIFLGLKAAVLAVVLQAVFRIGRRVLNGAFPAAIAALAFIGSAFFGLAFPLVVLIAGLAGALAIRPEPAVLAAADGARRPAPSRSLGILALGLTIWFLPLLVVLLFLGRDHVFMEIGLFFSQMAVVSFGGAYAVLSYVAQVAVDSYGWLTAGEMLDGLALAETTPGPLILVVQFVAFMGALRGGGPLDPMVAAVIGGLLASWVTFVPSFLWIFLGAPYVEALRGNRMLSGALAGVTAAVVGVILNLAFWFALRTWFAERRSLQGYGIEFDMPILSSLDPVALALSLFAMMGLFLTRLGMLPVLGLAALASLLLHMAGVAG